MVGVRDNKNNLQNVQKRHLNINSQIQVPFSNYTFFIGDISNLFLATSQCLMPMCLQV